MDRKKPKVWVEGDDIYSDCGVSGVIAWILWDAGKLLRPVEILERLDSQFGVKISKQRLNGYLNRAHKHDRLFKFSRGLYGDLDLLLMLS